jgi:hypothetical protein
MDSILESRLTPSDAMRTSLCEKSNRSPLCRNGNWKIASRDRRPKPAHRTDMPEICPPETEAHRPNLRRYGRLSPTGKNQARDRTAWLGREDSNLRMAESKSATLPIFPVREQAGASRLRLVIDRTIPSGSSRHREERGSARSKCGLVQSMSRKGNCWDSAPWRATLEP